MSSFKKYIFNAETLSYEVLERSARSRFIKSLVLFVASLGMAAFYVWIYTSVLGYELPKTVLLQKANARWNARMDIMNSQLDRYENTLEVLQVRDDDVYRSVFGMNEIPLSVRNAGFGGVDRYSWLDASGADSLLKNTFLRLDVLTKKTYIQSKSFDDVLALSKRAGDMASCIPAIPPIAPVPGTYRISSSFGYRSDPISGHSARHEGVDFACKEGNAIYATADGVVEKVQLISFGYGKNVIVDHGFGYKTRYGHMSVISVKEGDRVKRGEYIGASGNSGKSTGPHLHYEVLYKGSPVNPYNYYDLSMAPEEYFDLTGRVNSSAGMAGSATLASK